tara:strand:+ start:296 stop:655 length:360 start_codon:yes stop_codon:yes gene_type:complete
MKIFNVIILMCFILLISSCIEDNKKSISKSAGELVFEEYNCNACHTIGKGRLIGPDLKGVTKERKTSWLKSWIRNSKELIDSGDPDAIRLYNDYNQSPMPPYDLTDIEMAKLLEYLSEK